MNGGRKSHNNGARVSPLVPILGGLVVLAIIVVALALSHHNATTSVNTKATPTPTATVGLTADQNKSQFASPSPTSSPATTPTPSTANGKAITSFSVAPRSDGFHIATVITGITGGTCSVRIIPAGGSAVTASGTVSFSGQSYMCNFNGDVAGSGSSGSATLTVTASDGSISTQGATF